MNNFFKKAINLIDNKKCTVGIIGLGYVGLPLSILFVKNNFKIIGIDIDKNKINKIKKNDSYLDRISNKDIALINKNGKFFSNFNKIKICDIVIICVPTPLKIDQNPDLSFIRKTISSIKKFLRKGQTLILESTSYPGTTKEEIYSKIKDRFDIGKNFFLGFSSERINPGKNEDSIQKVPKVVSGFSKNCLKVISDFYGKSFNEIVISKSVEIAEFSKLLENIYRSVNIGFINEMKVLADKMNLDISKTGKNKFFYDVIYKPSETNFLKTAKKLGNRTENGKMMFIYQAQGAFKMWHRIQPKINTDVIKILD